MERTLPSTGTPPLPLSKARYLREGVLTVDGWLNRSTATYLSALEVLQRQIGVSGDVCEIGIYQGKSFLCLALGLPADQRAVAIDLFEDQNLNIDRSGRGNRGILQENLARNGAGENVVIMKADSTRLESQGFFDAGPLFRLFSVDGGHTTEITCNDLFVAQRSIVEQGIVALDDYLNPAWLGVMTGLFRYWEASGTLVPFAAIPGKLLLAADETGAKTYRQLMTEHFDIACTKREVPMGSASVDVFGEFPWVVLDELGGTGLLAGDATVPARSATATRNVPVDYLEDLERRARPLSEKMKEAVRPYVPFRARRAILRMLGRFATTRK